MDMNNNDSEEKNEVRHYRNRKKNDIINFPLAFRREIMSPAKQKEILEAPITSFRILFKILSDISFDQFQDKQRAQLNLFEDQFLTKNNTYSRFTFKMSDIDPNRNYTNVKKGLDFLEELNKGWYKAKNSRGKMVSSKGGVISNPNISEGEITFLVSAYWMNKLIKIPSYNVAFLDTAWKLTKSRHILFYLWLLEVPDTGTQVNFDRFQKVYEYNYDKVSEFNRSFLKPMKTKFDKYSNVSFNYSAKKNKINIVPYYTKHVNLNISKETIDKQKVTQKLHYWKVRHKLSTEDINTLKALINLDEATFGLFLNSYKNLVKKCREDKIPVSKYTGRKFISIFQNEIKITYEEGLAWSKIIPNGYPVIKNDED